MSSSTRLTEQDKPPASFVKSIADFFYILPKDNNWFDIKQDFFSKKTEERKNAWESYNLPIKELDNKFITVTKERNKLAKDMGYKDFVEMKLADNKYKIPKEASEKFLKNINKVISYCNNQLITFDKLPNNFHLVFGTSCYLCQVPSLPFKTLDETLDYMTNHSKVLNKFKSKIIINFGENSKMSYKEESDSFEITINNGQNIRHQSVDLIHELSHVINYLNKFEKGISPFNKGEYLAEKEALITELPIFKKISPFVYQSEFGHILSIFHSVLFQMELYKKPNQNLGKLYAKIFNKCFRGAKQKTNPLYILEDEIVLHPLSSLPHAVAYANSWPQADII